MYLRGLLFGQSHRFLETFESLLIDQQVPLIVQRLPVGLHIIEPDILRSPGTGFCENENGRAHPGVGFKHPAWHGDHRFQLVVGNNLLPERFMRLAIPEQHAIGDDHRAPAARLELPQHQGKEEQFGFGGIGNVLQSGRNALLVDGTLEGRIGKDERVGIGDGIVLAHRIHIHDIGLLHPVQVEVHRGDPQHGGIELHPVEHRCVDMFCMPVDLCYIVMVVDILLRRHKESGCSGRRIADDIVQRGLHKAHHHFNDMPWRAELSGGTPALQFREQVFVDIAFGIGVAHVDRFQLLHHQVERCRLGDSEIGTPHVCAEDAFLLPQGADKGKDAIHRIGENGMTLGHIHLLQVFPAEVLLLFVEDRSVFETVSSFQLVPCFNLIQVADKDQVGKLLHDGDGIGNSAIPEHIPDLVDL